MSKAEDGEKKRKHERKKEEERTMVITMAKLRIAHTSTHGARKPPGPKLGSGFNSGDMFKFVGQIIDF